MNTGRAVSKEGGALDPKFEPLRKILQLERDKGYRDVAVIGGLDRFLTNWSSQAEKNADKTKLPKPGYAALSNAQRRKWVAGVLDWLASLENGNGKRLSTPVRRKARAKPQVSAASAPKPVADGLASPVTSLRGISSALAAKFAKLGVATIRDMLYFFPNRHLDYSQQRPIAGLEVDTEQTIVANVWEAREVRLGLRKGTEAVVGDATGNIRVVWFNQPYLAKKLKTNDRIVISGKGTLFKGSKVFSSPEWELVESQDLLHTGRLVPIYPLTQGLYPRQVRTLVKAAVDRWTPVMADFLPASVKDSAGLMALPEAIRQAHYPDSELTKQRARSRLAFDELFLIQLGVLSKKQKWQEGQPGRALKPQPEILNAFLKAQPFALTLAQDKALKEILADIGRDRPMSRLLQGDVGSGKTVVATAALLVAIANGYQGALMAPTEILAEQHFGNICRPLEAMSEHVETQDCIRSLHMPLLPRPLGVALLTGSLSNKQKEEVQQRIASGEIDLVIGTHALIQKQVEFRSLALAVVDEQHRFGVGQRSALRQKGYNPHVLVMTATPIPRSLALTLYGDLDLSVIDQMPPGRQQVKTRWLAPEQRQRAYQFVRQQVSAGRQAFIVCPLIEESEAIEARAATVEYERLSQTVFPDLKLGLLHGRMSASEKDDAMRSFRAGELNILVSTPVVEVGIDVANATVMLVEGADRFGLSQLHQFRGRVGRGQHQSYCLLLAETPSAEARERLSIIESVQDGFRLAEEDLKMRGPGEFFGTRQSGLPDLKMARLSDVALLEMARDQATRLFQEDPALQRPEHRPLAQELARLWQSGGEWS